MNFIEDKIEKRGNTSNLRFRFPPNPNAMLHIGHAKSICLNFGLAEKYKAICNLRFDDTNPSVEKIEYVESIIEDIKWLGYEPSNVLYASDYFPFMYECAILLIKKGLAYVDDSTSEEIATLKGTPTSPGNPSPYYYRSIEENLDLFERMKNGEFVEGSRILRAKIDMTSSNMILRDPILYRIINKKHHHVGDAWKIYPMYDFAHPLSDYIEGITDSLCTMEFEVHLPLYMWVLKNCDLKNPLPEETEFARLNIDYTITSKRKLRRLVDEGIIRDLDDPRLPTISGLRRRGFTPKSIRDFCEEISVTRSNSIISHKVLEECLRVDLNKSANRMMGVMDPVKLTITNWVGGTEWVEVENNPEDPNAGTRLVPFTGVLWIEREDFRMEADKKFHRLKLNEEVRLKGGYVVKATDVVMDGDIITEIKCTFDPNSKSGMTLDRKVKGVIHWVSVEHAVNLDVNEYDTLFTESNPDELEDFTTCINHNSLVINTKAMFEPHIMTLEVGVPVQMMRKGYYCLDKDGGAFNKTVSLKESWKG